MNSSEIKNSDVILLKIYHRQGHELRDYTIPVLPFHCVRDVKKTIAAFNKVSPDNIILKKILEELSDDTEIRMIKKSKKDENNTLHLQAIIENNIIANQNNNIQKIPNLKDESESIISDSESSVSSAPNLFCAMKKCDEKYQKDKTFINNKRKREENIDYDVDIEHKVDYPKTNLFNDKIKFKNFGDQTDPNRQKVLEYFDPKILECQTQIIIIEKTTAEEIKERLNGQKNENKIIKKNKKSKIMKNNERNYNNFHNYSRSRTEYGDIDRKNRNFFDMPQDLEYENLNFNHRPNRTPNVNYSNNFGCFPNRLKDDNLFHNNFNIKNIQSNKSEFKIDEDIFDDKKLKYNSNNNNIHNRNINLENKYELNIKNENYPDVIKSENIRETTISKFASIQYKYDEEISDSVSLDDSDNSQEEIEIKEYQSVTDLMAKVLDIEDISNDLDNEKSKKLQENFDKMISEIKINKNNDELSNYNINFIDNNNIVNYNENEKLNEKADIFNEKEKSYFKVNDEKLLTEEKLELEDEININNIANVNFSVNQKENESNISIENKIDSNDISSIAKGEEEKKLINLKNLNSEVKNNLNEEPFIESSVTMDIEEKVKIPEQEFKMNKKTLSNEIENIKSNSEIEKSKLKDTSKLSKKETISTDKKITSKPLKKNELDKRIDYFDNENYKKDYNLNLDKKNNEKLKEDFDPNNNKNSNKSLIFVNNSEIQKKLENSNKITNNSNAISCKDRDLINENKIQKIHQRSSLDNNNNKLNIENKYSESKHKVKIEDFRSHYSDHSKSSNSKNKIIPSENNLITSKLLKSPNNNGLNDIFSNIKILFGEIFNLRFPKESPKKDQINILVEKNKTLKEILNKIPLDIAFNYSNRKKIYMVLDIDNTFLHAENTNNQQCLDHMINYANKNNVKRYYLSLTYKGKKIDMSYIFRKHIKEFFEKFKNYSHFLINSKGLDCYVQEIAKTLRDDFNIDIPQNRLVGRKENEKGKDLKYFTDYRKNEKEFLHNCIIVDDKPDNWDELTNNVITSHKFVSFSTEKLHNNELQYKMLEMIPLNISISCRRYAVWDNFVIRYDNNAPIVLEYEHSFNHQFKYLNEVFEHAYKISMIANFPMASILQLIKSNIFIGMNFYLDGFIADEKNLGKNELLKQVNNFYYSKLFLGSFGKIKKSFGIFDNISWRLFF